MTNDEVYASGLLNRALDPATQPPEIQAFMRAEHFSEARLRSLVGDCAIRPLADIAYVVMF